MPPHLERFLEIVILIMPFLFNYVMSCNHYAILKAASAEKTLLSLIWELSSCLPLLFALKVVLRMMVCSRTSKAFARLACPLSAGVS